VSKNPSISLLSLDILIATTHKFRRNIKGNTWGGGINTFRAVALLRNLKICDNSAHGGGGILSQSGSIEIQNVALYNNESDCHGGCINATYCEMSLQFVDMHDNRTGEYGTFRTYSSQVSFDHVTITDNSFDDNRGVITLVSSTDLTVRNSIL